MATQWTYMLAAILASWTCTPWNVMGDNQRAPALMGFTAVRQELEIPLDHAREPVRFRDGKTEAVFVERARGGVPEFGQGLGGVAETHPLPDQCFQRPNDDGVLWIIALADAQENIAVEKTRLAFGHQP